MNIDGQQIPEKILNTGSSVDKYLLSNAGDMGLIPDPGQVHLLWAAKPILHNYWASPLEPMCHSYWSPCALRSMMYN